MPRPAYSGKSRRCRLCYSLNALHMCLALLLAAALHFIQMCKSRLESLLKSQKRQPRAPNWSAPQGPEEQRPANKKTNSGSPAQKLSAWIKRQAPARSAGNHHPRAVGLSKLPGSQEKRRSRILNTVTELRTQLTPQFAKNIGGVFGSAKKQANVAYGSRGDTIIEVMLAMTILAVVLATAYATSNHSLQTGFNSQYRDQALSYAQQQVELIKNADNTSSAAVAAYQLNQFCIDPSNTQVQSVDSTTKVCAWPLGSNDANPSQYSLQDAYSPSSKTYTSTVQWQSANGITNQVVIYYKTHDSFITTTGASAPPTAPISTAPPPVGLTISADPTPPKTLAWNGSATVTWSSTTALSCTALGDWSGNKTLSGREAIDNIKTSSTFSMKCTGLDGTSSVTKSASVAVDPAPVPILNFSADSNSISYGGSTTLRWSTDTNATSCIASGAWSGNKALPSGSQGTGVLTSSQTYKLYCMGAGGNSPTKTVTVAVSAPPAPSMNYFYASPGSVGYGGSTTLYWSSNNATSCTWGGSTGSVGTGALYSNAGYTVNCSGLGGTTSAYTVVYVSPPPPPPPPPCRASAGGWRSGNLVWITGGGSSCSYYLDSVVGWNGGGVWGPYNSPGTFCHTQNGGADPWGWISSASWCG